MIAILLCLMALPFIIVEVLLISCWFKANKIQRILEEQRGK